MLKTVYFDLGNVLIFVNFPKLLSGLKEISGLSIDQIDKFLNGSNLKELYETGAITTQELYFTFLKQAKKRFSQKEFEDAFCNIFTPNREAWSIVKDLKKSKVRLVLLSNTSECHFEYSKKNYPVLELFDHYILSYKIGAWKPSPQIFKEALQVAECKPEECFYTDDIPEFIKGAEKVGLPGAVFTDATALNHELNRRGICI